MMIDRETQTHNRHIFYKKAALQQQQCHYILRQLSLCLHALPFFRLQKDSPTEVELSFLVERNGLACLRAGPLAALTRPRRVIHSRSASSPFDCKKTAPQKWSCLFLACATKIDTRPKSIAGSNR